MSVIGAAEVAIRPDTSTFAEDLKSKIGDALKNPAVIAGAAVAAVGATVTAFAKVSVDKFKEVGSQVSQLTKTTGQSAESMSRLRFAADSTGVSTDTLAGGLKKLGLTIGSNGDSLKKMGIAYTDAKGKALPLNETLANVADKFKNMPAGIEKNNLAIQLFGKTGTDLIPILNKGKDGLKELGAESDKYGLTLTGKNLDSIRQNAKAHKELQDALEGVKVQVGAALMPVMASFAEFIASKAVPVLLTITQLVKTELAPILSVLAGAVGDVYNSFVKGFTNTSKVSSNLGILGSIFHSFGEDVKKVFNLLYDAYDAFVGGFQNPYASIGSHVDLLDKIFLTFGADVKKLFEDAVIAYGSFKDGFKDSSSIVDEVGPVAVAFAALGAVFGVARVGLADLVDFIKTQAIPWVVDEWHKAEPTIIQFWNSFKENIGKVKDVTEQDLIPKLIDLWNTLKDNLLPAVENVAHAFANELGPALSQLSAQNIVPVLIGMGALAEALNQLSEFGPLTALFQKLGFSIGGLAIPGVAVAGVIAGLGIAATVAYEKFRPFHDLVDETANFFLDSVLPKFQQFGDFLVQTLTSVGVTLISQVLPSLLDFGNYVIGLFTQIVDFVKAYWPEIAQAIKEVMIVVGVVVVGALLALKIAWDIFHNDIFATVKGVWDLIGAEIKFALKIILDDLAIFLDLITGHWGRAWDDMGKLFADYWTGMFAVLNAAFEIIKGIVGIGLDAILFIFKAIWDSIVAVVKGVFDEIKLLITTELDILKYIFFNWTGPGFLIAHWKAISSGGKEEFDKLKKTVIDTLDSVVGFIGGMETKIEKAASGMWNGITNAFKSAINAIINGWNSLKFTTPSFDAGPIHYQGFTIGVPHIPNLADGGVIPARPGGTVFRGGEAGSDEAIVPLNSGFVQMLVQAMRTAGVGNNGSKIENLTIQNSKTLQENLDEIDRLSLGVA